MVRLRTSIAWALMTWMRLELSDVLHFATELTAIRALLDHIK
jgi:hypothetical protein